MGAESAQRLLAVLNRPTQSAPGNKVGAGRLGSDVLPCWRPEVEMAELYVKPGERGGGLETLGPPFSPGWILPFPRARFTHALPFAGNKKRGWNDPPQFSYGLQTQAGGPKRTPLTKRVAAPQDGAPRGVWGTLGAESG